MRMIRPQLAAPTINVAEEQDEYKTVVAALVTNPLYKGSPNTTIVCYRPTDEERQQLVAGADVYLHFLGSVAPHIVSVGAERTAEMYRIEVDR